MPKTIKKEQINRYEKINRIWAIVAMGVVLAFTGTLIFLLPALLEDESAVKATVISVAYLLFTVSCIIHCVTAFVSYGKAESASGLFHGILSLACTFMSLLNLRFVLALFFSGIKAESIADKIIGDHTMTEFVELQTSNWTCLVFAMAVMLILGILGIIRLAKR